MNPSPQNSSESRATDLEPLSFEQAFARLEEIVRKLEEGGLSLEDSLSHYEKGVALLRQCYAQLRDAEQRVLALVGDDGEGRPILEPFETSTIGDSDLTQLPRRARRAANLDDTTGRIE